MFVQVAVTLDHVDLVVRREHVVLHDIRALILRPAVARPREVNSVKLPRSAEMTSLGDRGIMMGTNGEPGGIGLRATGRRCGVLAVTLIALLVAACAPAAPTPPGPGPLTPAGKATLTQLKRSHYGQLALTDADLISTRRRQPIIGFTVEDTPPSIFVNWVVPETQAAAFSAAVGLPPGFSLAKTLILESDPEPQYWLSLNVYRVSGITNGLRAEWSTYVDDGGGEPRFMIIRARTSEGSLDPIGPLALPEPFTHSVDSAGAITTGMNATVIQGGVPVLTAANLFSSTIQLPAVADRRFVVPDRQWVAANDYIYWLNGVNDRVFHNSTSHSAPLISVDLQDVALDDDSEWTPFVEPIPAHVLVYLDTIEFVISPWWNVTAVDGRVAPATVASLSSFKSSLYSGQASSTALGVLSGTAEPTVQSSVGGTPPSVRWHWRIPDAALADFRSAASPPLGLDLAAVRLQDDDTDPAYWLSLHVFGQSGDDAGLRAEWTTYVNDNGHIRTLILESRADRTSLDPVNLTTAPYPIAHGLTTDTMTTTVGAGPEQFSAEFVVPPTAAQATVWASREWVGSADLRYWRNGVADRVTYSSTVFDPRTSIDAGTVALSYGGQFSPFADSTPDRVWLDRSSVDMVTNPWWNLSTL